MSDRPLSTVPPSTGRKTVLLMVAALALLLTAIGLIIYGQTRPLEQTFHGKLADLLPPAPAGWTRTERPIADTPEMKQKVNETLNFDDGVFYDYTNGNLRLSVYIAYWAPGKMSSRLVAGHTPDVCWVGAGWECTERGEVTPPPSAIRDPLSVGGTPSSRDGLQSTARGRAGYIPQLPPAESRTFAANGTTEYVWFWHLVGGESQSYGTGKQPPWYAFITDMMQAGFSQRGEQFFIRLSSPLRLDDPALAQVLEPTLKALPLHSAATKTLER